MQKDALIFFSFRSHKSGYIETLFAEMAKHAASKQGLSLHRGALKELVVRIHNNQLLVTESLTGRDLASFDVVYFELWYKAQQQALAAATYLTRKGVPFFTKETTQITPITKLGEMSVLSDQGLPLPETFVSSKHETLKAFKKNPPLAYPVIVKAVGGFGGRKNYLVHSFTALKDVYRAHPDDTFVVQEFIPNDFDYRCLMIGGEIVAIIKRQRGEGTHLNNASKGSATTLLDASVLTPQQVADVKKAARLLHCDDLSGVDLLINKETGAHVILEVNLAPQIETGAHVSAKTEALLAYMHRRAEGGE